MRTRVGIRVAAQSHRGEQCALRVGADDVPLAGDIPPVGGDAGRRREPVEHVRRDARARRRRATLPASSHDDDERPRGDASSRRPPRHSPASGIPSASAVSMQQCQAKPSRAVGPVHVDRIVAGVERDGDLARGACGSRRSARSSATRARQSGVRPVAQAPSAGRRGAAIRRRAIRWASNGAPVSQRSSRNAACRLRNSTSRATKAIQRVVRVRPVDPGQRVVLRVARCCCRCCVRPSSSPIASIGVPRDRKSVASRLRTSRARAASDRRRRPSAPRRRDSTSRWHRCRRGCPRRSPRCACSRRRRDRRA